VADGIRASRKTDAFTSPKDKTPLKTKLTKRRYKAPKGSSCPLCKPNKHGGDDKKTFRDVKKAVTHSQEMREEGLAE